MKRKFKIKIETSLNGNIWYYAMYRWNGIKYLFGWYSYLLNFKTEEEAIQQIKEWKKQDDFNSRKGHISYKIVNL